MNYAEMLQRLLALYISTRCSIVPTFKNSQGNQGQPIIIAQAVKYMNMYIFVFIIFVVYSIVTLFFRGFLYFPHSCICIYQPIISQFEFICFTRPLCYHLTKNTISTEDVKMSREKSKASLGKG